MKLVFLHLEVPERYRYFIQFFITAYNLSFRLWKDPLKIQIFFAFIVKGGSERMVSPSG